MRRHGEKDLAVFPHLYLNVQIKIRQIGNTLLYQSHILQFRCFLFTKYLPLCLLHSLVVFCRL